MTGFHDIRFPIRLAFGASGGPVRRTDITPLANGAEVRNTPHARSRRRYDAAAGVKSVKDLRTIISFFEARMGQLYAFRFRDPVDHHAENVGLGIGGNALSDFQCQQIYSDSAAQTMRPITKPDVSTLVVQMDGVDVDPSQYSVDALSGIISFVDAPSNGTVITASFDFDVAVRFDTDNLSLSLEAFGAGEITSIPLIEVLDYV